MTFKPIHRLRHHHLVVEERSLKLGYHVICILIYANCHEYKVTISCCIFGLEYNEKKALTKNQQRLSTYPLVMI